MAKFNENQKLGIVAAVTVLLCGGGGAGVWWAKGLVEEKTGEIAAMRDQIQACEVKIRRIPKVEEEVIVLRENLQEYVKILPEEDEINHFVRITNQFVDQSGVHMNNFLPGRVPGGKSSPFERYTYKFSINSTLWQFLHFVSLFESYERFVRIVDFSLSAGSQRDRKGGRDIIHSITINVETYRYRGSKGEPDVPIPNYANKVEKLRERIFQERQAIPLESYEFGGANNRRDIFTDPRETKTGPTATNGGISLRDQKRIMTRIVQRITESQNLYRRTQNKDITIFERYNLERNLRRMMGEIEQQVEELAKKNTISHPPLKRSWSRDVMEPLAQLRRRLRSGQERDRFASEDEMRQTLVGMKDDLTGGMLQSAVDRYDAMNERLRVPEGDPRYKLSVDIEGLYLRAKLALEFSTLQLDINGLCVNHSGKSGVILNGSVYEEGDYVDNNLLLKTVRRDRVEFIYKGFTVVKTL